ncbi:hypothetical protein AL755_10055 [Arthrobacter sp. ERGS1:01]|uniref:hypothetical protein n=1 Tax=Arthrobacter sp. ERGS1:01 TaxID=1704044 RepID=UPI0006B50BA8|nr:hypothetical protein [Arthrobacter sp. ERGS1:01]ALE05732.1 hypothetical protein AL755_10055 [Arthrobacter sp. ERGS1:01]
MLTIENDQLVVDIIDPRNDRDYLGTRYCSGGYIFQVTDKTLGPLLSGPTFPDSYNVFDGQGIPDSFNLAPLRGARDAPALVLGVGVCDLVGNTVREPCRWTIDSTRRSIVFTTRQEFQGWAVELERTVTLAGRTVRSNTVLRNVGADRLPLIWFPHPFFPQLPQGSDELIKLNLAVELPENEAYGISPNGYLCRLGWPWTGDYYQALDVPRSGELVILQRHPVLGLVGASCNYAPTYFPIWGNRHTFSWEPMIERTVAPGQVADWRIDYDF